MIGLMNEKILNIFLRIPRKIYKLLICFQLTLVISWCAVSDKTLFSVFFPRT